MFTVFTGIQNAPPPLPNLHSHQFSGNTYAEHFELVLDHKPPPHHFLNDDSRKKFFLYLGKYGTYTVPVHFKNTSTSVFTLQITM
jgi:hypothetical protein